MEHVKTYPKAEDDIVLMDWKFSFTPNDHSDMTTKQIKNAVNPKIVLEIRIGKAMISKGMDVIVEDMAFSGLMRVKIKLQLPFPHVDRVEICFLERRKFPTSRSRMAYFRPIGCCFSTVSLGSEPLPRHTRQPPIIKSQY